MVHLHTEYVVGKKKSEKQSLRMQKSNNMKLQNASNEVALIQFYI